MPQPLFGASAVYYDNTVYIVGGVGQTVTPTITIYSFNLQTKTWKV